MRWLHELDQDAAGRLRMHEGHLVPARAGPRRLVDERHAEPLQEGEGRLDSLHLDRDVVQARPALLEELREPLVPARSDELDVAIADRDEDGLRLL